MAFKAYKIRLYPTKQQEILLNKTFGSCRFVWNKLLEKNQNAYKNNEPQTFSYKPIRDENEFLKEVSARALEFECQFLRNTFMKFFKGQCQYPKFKSKNDRRSYTLDGNRFCLVGNCIKLEKMSSIKYAGRVAPKNSTPKRITISKTTNGKFFASILVEEIIIPKEKSGKVVGIDMGLTNFITTSDGIKYPSNRFLRDNQAELSKAQRHLSRKTKGSNRYKRQKIKVSTVHEKISNRRNWFLHDISNELVDNYDIICVEDLSVKTMMKNHILAKSISDASWSEFIRILSYKADWYGKEIRKVDTYFPSSKTCSRCGYVTDKMSLNIRKWECPSCKTSHDRDINAARNILNKALS